MLQLTNKRVMGSNIILYQNNIASLLSATGASVLVRPARRSDEGVFPTRASLHTRISADTGHEPQP